MSPEDCSTRTSEELRSLTASMCDGVILPHQRDRLETLLANDGEAREFYVFCMALHAQLLWRHQGRTDEVMRLAALEAPTLPLVAFFDRAIGGTTGYFATGWPAAYLVATVIFGLGLLLGSHIYMSPPEEVAHDSAPSVVVEPKVEAVGRITGMVDCKWEKKGLGIRDWGLEKGSGFRVQGTEAENHQFRAFQSLIPNPQSLVHLGDKFVLTSGLIEITYDTGAKVILQGPVTYDVESNGGYLSLGKLTGKLEKRGEGREERGEADKSEIRNQKSELSGPSPLSPLLSPLFVIRTPTATVTDLGTEFGVEVTKDQQNHLHVFQGKVVLRMETSTAGAPRQIEVNAGDSASVDPRGVVTHYSGPQARTALKAIGFVRKISRSVIKALDLVDIVAGGNGFGKARDRGIHPNTGEIVDRLPPADVEWQMGVSDGRYHRVKGLPFVDGVFVPDDRRGPVQLDSAGHTFDGFHTSDNRIFDYIWGGGKLPAPGAATITILGGVDYGHPTTRSWE